MKKNNEKLKNIIPGFRTNTLWKKIVAVFGYVFLIFGFIIILITPNEYGNRTDEYIDKIENIISVLIIIGIPFLIITNFKDVRNKLPLFKKHKIGFTILGSLAVYFMMCIVGSLTGIVVEELHSEQYYADIREAQELQEKVAEEKKAKEEIAKKEAEEEAKKEAAVEKKAKEDAEKKAVAEKKAKEEAEKKAAAEKKAKEEAEKKAVAEKKAKEDAEKKAAAEKKAKEEIVAESEDSEFENYPFCSEEYLLYHIKKNQLKINRFTNKYTQLKKSESQLSNVKPVNVTEKSKILQGKYYVRTREDTSLIYVGGLKDNKPDGIGVLYEVTNSFTQPYYAIIYEGGFKNGKFDGYGIEHKLPEDDFDTGFVSGSETNYALLYEDFMGDEQSNILLSTNPYLYEGMFENGVYSGKGVLYTYSMDIRSMEMRESNENEETDVDSSDEIPLRLFIMSGSFKKGKANGKFISYDQGILAYEGDMKNNEPTGEGKLYYPLTGQLRYEGGLKNGQYHGKGTLYDDNGNVEYSGEWNMGDYAD